MFLKARIVVIGAICIGVCVAQQPKVNDTTRVQEFSAAQNPVAVVYQPACPVKIEQPIFYHATDVRSDVRFGCKLRNTGSKPVKFVTIMAINFNGGFNTYSIPFPKVSIEQISAPTVLGDGGQLAKLPENSSVAVGEQKVNGFKLLLILHIYFEDGGEFSDEQFAMSLADKIESTQRD